jgi:hypothetical protein
MELIIITKSNWIKKLDDIISHTHPWYLSAK